jgi:hypothetical protein
VTLLARLEALVIETLAAIDAPHFLAGVVLWNDRVVEAADIVGYMKRKRWTRDQVRDYCRRQGWTITVVHQIERRDIVRSTRRP